jgi:hypothetical protein
MESTSKTKNIRVWNWRIPFFEGVVQFEYYDQGSDMYEKEAYYVKINEEGVETKGIENIKDLNEWEAYENYEKLKKEVFSIVSKIWDKINNGYCPRCNKRLRRAGSRTSYKSSEYAGFVSSRYADASPYDSESEKVFTCKCGVEIVQSFETWDGGSVLNWRHTIRFNGKEANLEKVGYFNEHRLFWENINFLDSFIKMAKE